MDAAVSAGSSGATSEASVGCVRAHVAASRSTATHVACAPPSARRNAPSASASDSARIPTDAINVVAGLAFARINKQPLGKVEKEQH